MFNPVQAVDKISAWMQKQVENAGAKGIAFGLSGGIDSAVVGFLGKRVFGDNVLGIIMPCHSLPQDAADAQLVAAAGNIKTKTVKLDRVFDELLIAANEEKEINELHAMAEANIKPRLRMTTLYYFAQKNGLLVAGTGNLSEKTIGYFTKYGDSGVDMLPIADLVKSEVREVAKCLGIPEKIITKPPSAGLWEGQTDEEEMGISYRDLDLYIRQGVAPENVKNRIEKMVNSSAHKLVFPPYCKI